MKKMLSKKISLATLIAVLVFAGVLSACSAPSPSDVVKTELDLLTTEDVGQLAAHIDTAGMGVKFPDSFLKKLQELNYTLGEEVVTEDTAIVEVTITTYDFGAVYTASRETFYREYFSKSDANLTDEEQIQELFDTFFAAAENADFSYTETVPVSLTKVDGKWVMDDVDDDNPLGNAFWGGLLDAMRLSPADVVKEEFDYFTYQNASRFSDVLSTDADIVYPKDIIKMIQSLEYTIGEETITGDQAAVEVTINTYDFGAVYLTSTEAYLKNYVLQLKAGDQTAANLTDTELNQEMFDAFFAAAPNAEFSYTETLTVTLSKVDGQWTMDMLDTDASFTNALWGGLIKAPEEMNEKMQDSAYVDSLMS